MHPVSGRTAPPADGGGGSGLEPLKKVAPVHNDLR